MGSGTSIRCSYCNHEIILFEGIGMRMMPDEYENAPSIKPNGWDIIHSKKILKEVDNLMRNKNGKFISESKDIPDNIKIRNDIKEYYAYGYKVYYSHNTKKIYNLFYFIIRYEEDGILKYYEPNYVDKFNKPLEMLNDCDEVYFYEVVCPKCKKNMAHHKSNTITMINWD